MIKINLLPQKKKAREARPGELDVAIGLIAVAGAFVGVYFGYHTGQSAELKKLQKANVELAADNETVKADVDKQKDLEQVIAAEQQREASISKLVHAESVPANVMQELGDVLTGGRPPTMTSGMAARVSDGPQGDPNRRFAPDWDPKHVWITSFVEKGGAFEVSSAEAILGGL